MENLRIYEKVRKVPKEAQKPISAGKLKGFTDINPMWRIKALTECFGPVGFGWYYKTIEKWEEQHGDEVLCFVNIHLFVKSGDEWSQPIEGTGGSKTVAREKNGPYADDEAYKKATTDAIGNACKSLGVGADVYWGSDRTKYTTEPEKPATEAHSATGDANAEKIDALKWRSLTNTCTKKGIDYRSVLQKCGVKNGSEMTLKMWMDSMAQLDAMPDKEATA